MDAFLLIGAIIVMGFIARYISERYSISEVILLMLFGIVLGPVLGFVDASPTSPMYQIYPIMGGLALILILFDGGLSIQVRSLLKTLSRSTIFTVTSFILTVIVTVLFGFAFHIDLLYSLLMGAILGGTSSISILTMLGDVKLPTETKSLMTTESILTDILVIITVLIIIDFIAVPHFYPDQVLSNLFSAVSISIVFGGLTAWLWDRWMKTITVSKRYYIGTLAVMFLLYSVSKYVHASGGLSVFVFALTLANMNKVVDVEDVKSILSDKIRPIHAEIVFFTKTFFFTYLGLLYPLYSISFNIVLWSVLLTALYFVVRFLAYQLVLAKEKSKYIRDLIVPMLPRGLAAAVMVGYVIDKGILIHNLLEVVFTVLFLTSFIATIGLWAFKRIRRLKEEKKKDVTKPEKDTGKATGSRAKKSSSKTTNHSTKNKDKNSSSKK